MTHPSALLVFGAGRKHADVEVGVHVGQPNTPLARKTGVHEDVELGLLVISVLDPGTREFFQ